jgi:polyhydroxyalkanoate synthase
MNAGGANSFGDDVCRDFAEFVDKAILSQRTGAAGGEYASSAATQKLLFLLDEAARLIDALRKRVAGDAPTSDGGKTSDPPSAFRGKGFAETLQLIIAQALRHPESLARHYAAFAGHALEILNNGSELKPDPRDFRFRDDAWGDSNFYRSLLQLYLAWAQTMQQWLNEQTFDDTDRKRVAFIFDQLIAAFAPSNLPLNPAALKRARESDGESAATGLRTWLGDIVTNYGMPRQIRPDAFALGRDLALSEGAVVLCTPQLELIHYRPRTDVVRGRPILLIPPQINKYYIFDLKPKNSMIGHLVQSGLQMFTISWRNPSETEAEWNLDTYVASTLQVLDAIRSITESPDIGLVSACAGGLTAMALIGYLAEVGQRRVANHSLLVTSLFANHGSAMELFATAGMLERVRRYTRGAGVMEGSQLAKVFAWLRPTDLVWRYWINNYLMGRTPPALDVLHWDNDSTKLPAALNGDFLDMYAKDVFRRPNELKVLGRSIDFRKVAVDSYFVGGEDDYLMPWHGCYEAYRHFAGRHEFVLSTSGHVQSILRPPRLANTIYYTNAEKPERPEDWRRTATRHDGSWWEHWHQWLADRSGKIKSAPAQLGNSEFATLSAAPGRYVHG